MQILVYLGHQGGDTHKAMLEVKKEDISLNTPQDVQKELDLRKLFFRRNESLRKSFGQSQYKWKKDVYTPKDVAIASELRFLDTELAIMKKQTTNKEALKEVNRLKKELRKTIRKHRSSTAENARAEKAYYDQIDISHKSMEAKNRRIIELNGTIMHYSKKETKEYSTRKQIQRFKNY